ncbi:hypothetical protein [Alienimonas sp. DA493]|uniref:hypothetical protein n=1 Tax=Alienimonas sp. DA493 TaxID=3373605 RepID=UPI0037546D25
MPTPPTSDRVTRASGLPRRDRRRNRYTLSVGGRGDRRRWHVPGDVPPAEAAARRERIRAVYEAEGRWTDVAVHLADQIRTTGSADPRGAGQMAAEAARRATGAVISASWGLHLIRRLHQGVPMTDEAEGDSDAAKSARRRLRQTVISGYEAAVRLDALGEPIPPPPNDLPDAAALAAGAARIVRTGAPPRSVEGTLHGALTRYLAHVRDEAPRSADRHAKIRALLTRHDDLQLAALDLDACRRIVDYWRRRPENLRTGDRYTAKRARQMVAEALRFLRWLHLDGDSAWREPADLHRLDRRVSADTPDERTAAGTGMVETFSADDLAKLLRHGDCADRLLLTLALNVSGGAAEAGRVAWGHLHPAGRHPWAVQGLDVPPAEHGWIGFVRAKSGVMGWWPMWETTARLLAEARARAGAEDAPSDRRVLLTSAGRPLYRDGGGGYSALKNAQAGVAKRWTALRKRCEEAGDPVPNLPFGAVRKAFPGWATQAGVTADAVETVLCHGSPHPSGPLLYRHYSSRPWRAAFAAVREYGDYLERPLTAGFQRS